MADARVKLVLTRIIDDFSRARNVHDAFTDATQFIGGRDPRRMDTIEVPTIAGVTSRAGDTRATTNITDPVDPSIDTLVVDQFPIKDRRFPEIDVDQLMEGNVVTETARKFTAQLRNETDAYLLGLAVTAATTGFTEFNGNGDAVTRNDFDLAEASMLEQDGTEYMDMFYVYHPQAIPQIRGFFDPPRERPGAGVFGFDDIRSINGIPAIMSASLPLGTGSTPRAALMDRNRCFFARQRQPGVKMVDDTESMSTILQVGTTYGGVITSGGARLIDCGGA